MQPVNNSCSSLDSILLSLMYMDGDEVKWVICLYGYLCSSGIRNILLKQ